MLAYIVGFVHCSNFVVYNIFEALFIVSMVHLLNRVSAMLDHVCVHSFVRAKQPHGHTSGRNR